MNFTGMGPDFVVHDSAATETMGPLYDRGKEHLGSSDKAVIAVRNYLIRTVKAVAAGAEPPNLVFERASNRFPHVGCFNEIIDGQDWRAAYPHLRASAEDTLVAGSVRRQSGAGFTAHPEPVEG